MLETVLSFLIGLAGGVSVGIQSPIAGAMSQRIGSVASSFILHFSGTLVSGLLLLARGGEGIRDWRALPWYMLISGLFGVFIVLTISHTLPRLGTGAALTLILVGQLLTAMLVDHFGWLGVPVRPIDVTRMMAAGLLLLGGFLMVR